MTTALADAERIAGSIWACSRPHWMASQPQHYDWYASDWQVPTHHPQDYVVKWLGGQAQVPGLDRAIPVWFELYERCEDDDSPRGGGWLLLGRVYSEEDARTAVEMLCGILCDWIDAAEVVAGDTPLLRYMRLVPRNRQYSAAGSRPRPRR